MAPYKKRPAWVDDDEKITVAKVVESNEGFKTQTFNLGKKYQKVAAEKFVNITARPTWLNKKKEATSNNKDSDLLLHGGKFKGKSEALPKENVEVKKLKDLNCETYNEGTIVKVIKFHPTSTVAFVGGVSGNLSVVKVDGKDNSKLLSTKFESFDIACGDLLIKHDEFLVGSHNFRYFYSLNLVSGKTSTIDTSHVKEITGLRNFKVSPNGKYIAVCGRYGKIFLLSAKSKELIDTFKMNGNVNAIDFNGYGTKLFSHGDNGEVYIWDMRRRSCIQKFIDEGCLAGSTIAVSPNNQYIACGSSSGVVNLYDYEAQVSGTKIGQPLKVLYNLVTPITNLQFNYSGEILSMSSSYKESAMKLLHCQSLSVFANFPPQQNNIKRPICVEFSPNSGYIAIGGNNGCASLYKLKYYKHY